MTDKKTTGYNAGEFVVYPAHGVGKVVGTETQEVAGCSLSLVAINFEHDRMTLRVPVGKTNNSGLRPLATKEDMQKAMEKLRGRPRVRRARWSQRAQEYEAKINSGDPLSIAEVIRDLFREEGAADQSYSERQIYRTAVDRLAREFAAIEEIDEEKATEQLEEMLKKVA